VWTYCSFLGVINGNAGNGANARLRQLYALLVPRTSRASGSRLVSEDGAAGMRCSRSRSIVRINVLYYIGESNLDVQCLPIAFAYRKRYWEPATSSATAVTVIARYYETSNDPVDNGHISGWLSQATRRYSSLIPRRHVEAICGI